MKQTYAILPEKNVIASYALSHKPTSDASLLMEYLQSHKVGVTTGGIKKSFRNIVIKKAKDRKSLDEALKRIDGLETFLKTENVPYSEIKEKITKVEEVFRELMEGKDSLLQPWSVSPSFQNLIPEIYSYQNSVENRDNSKKKIFQEPIEYEDKKIIAIGTSLRESKYDNMFIASFDLHMIDEIVSKAIKEKLGVVCKTPQAILSELKLHLFR